MRIKAVLVGRPNTGKSSLCNALAGDRAALVSDLPGTTRDYLIAELDLAGVKCHVVDTAGTGGEGEGRGGGRERGEPLAVSCPEDAVESAAQSAAAEQRHTADVEVLCLDSTRRLDEWERDALRSDCVKSRVLVLTKCDAPRGTDCNCTAVETSSVTGPGNRLAPGRTAREGP